MFQAGHCFTVDIKGMRELQAAAVYAATSAVVLAIVWYLLFEPQHALLTRWVKTIAISFSACCTPHRRRIAAAALPAAMLQHKVTLLCSVLGHTWVAWQIASGAVLAEASWPLFLVLQFRQGDLTAK